MLSATQQMALQSLGALHQESSSASREKARGKGKDYFIYSDSNKAHHCDKRQPPAYLSSKSSFFGHGSDQRNVDENASKTRQDDSIHAGRRRYFMMRDQRCR
jgi:hypothetical protein